MCLTQAEKTHIRECTTSKDMWDSLKTRHRKQGNITQISLIEEAFSLRFAHDATILDMMQKIADLVKHIFDIGIPDKDAFHQLILLNAMSTELRTMRDAINTQLSTSSASKEQLASIRSALEREYRQVEKGLKETERSNTAVVNTVQSSGKSTEGPRCGTPGCHGQHLTKNCFAKGGPMEGRKDEVLAERKKARETCEQEKKARDQKSNIAKTKHFVDEDGKAYTIVEDVETVGSAIEVTSNRELCALVSQYGDISDSELSMALIDLDTDNLKASVDWKEHVNSFFDITETTVKPIPLEEASKFALLSTEFSSWGTNATLQTLDALSSTAT
ncbi:hypothetical protein K435DRAFT_791610 [Dendrothele bispora CBS 962.96]|uniref:Uncharacterized protein n=1 Tax=Dendrothele bispora (strain CBS 962.96) TaxID=1314807 RepID=A0A4S8MM06_DENBC|nr:hypothetical protein K435DRAFT_791610 [Dendrothele bispora CBS 962.96]